MKRMNNLKNVIAAKIMGGMVIGMTAVAGVAPVTVFAQSQEVECICEEKCSQDSINDECAVCLYDYNVCEGVDAHVEGSEECTETTEESYGPLTPDGNMNLVDDYGSIEAGGKFSASHMKFIMEQEMAGKDVTWLPIGKILHRSIVDKPLTRDQIRRIKERMQRAEPKDSVIADLHEKKKEAVRVPKKQGQQKEKGGR